MIMNFSKVFAFIGFLQCLSTVNGLEFADESQLNLENFFKNKHVVLIFLNDKVSVEELKQLDKFKALIDELNESTSQQQIQVLAVQNQALAAKHGIVQFPHVRYFRDENFVVYGNDHLNPESLFNWIEETVEKKTRRLSDSSFEHDTQASTGSTTGDWFVLFHDNECKQKTLIEPLWELAAIRLENRVNFAYVDLDQSQLVRKRFQIESSPALIFFRHNQMYKYNLPKYDLESILSFCSNGWYKHVKAVRVPRELMWFDQFTDDVVSFLKEKDEFHVYAAFGGLTIVFLIASVWTYNKFTRKSDEDLKTE